MTSKRTIWTVLTGGVLVTGLGAAVVLASPAAAADATTAGRIAALDGAKPAICQHLDKISQRESRLVARLGADANTRGSIAWLKAKADAATQAGETELAAMYTDRATRRSQILDTLNAIGPDLAALVKAHCS
jgi:hypothetical protein